MVASVGEALYDAQPNPGTRDRNNLTRHNGVKSKDANSPLQ